MDETGFANDRASRRAVSAIGTIALEQESIVTTASHVRLPATATLYPPDLGLFTIPDVEDDPQGRRLLDLISQVIRSHDLAICPAPEHFRTIRIGIETEGIPEVVVAIGMVNQRFAMRFVAHPSFPLWLTSDEIHRNMTSIAE